MRILQRYAILIFRKKEIEDYNAYIFISVFYILLYSPMYPLYSSYLGTFIKYYKISQLIHTQIIAN